MGGSSRSVAKSAPSRVSKSKRARDGLLMPGTVNEVQGLISISGCDGGLCDRCSGHKQGIRGGVNTCRSPQVATLRVACLSLEGSSDFSAFVSYSSLSLFFSHC